MCSHNPITTSLPRSSSSGDFPGQCGTGVFFSRDLPSDLRDQMASRLQRCEFPSWEGLQEDYLYNCTTKLENKRCGYLGAEYVWQHCWKSGFLAGSKTSFLLVTQEGRAGGSPGCFSPSLPALRDVSLSSRHCCPLGAAPKLLESSPCLQRLMGRADFQVGGFAQKWVSKRAGRRQALAKTKNSLTQHL